MEKVLILFYYFFNSCGKWKKKIKTWSFVLMIEVVLSLWNSPNFERNFGTDSEKFVRLKALAVKWSRVNVTRSVSLCHAANTVVLIGSITSFLNICLKTWGELYTRCHILLSMTDMLFPVIVHLSQRRLKNLITSFTFLASPAWKEIKNRSTIRDSYKKGQK